MGVGDSGVTAHVLEAFGEGEQEGVKHFARQKHLAGAVPADLESHAPETLLDRLQGGAERCLLDRFEVVDAGRLRNRCRPKPKLAQ